MEEETIIERWVSEARGNAHDLEIGRDISPLPQIKIAFDGYAEDDDGNEEDSQESYAVYIHRDAADDGFVFPPHDEAGWAVIHRPRDEACCYVWYNQLIDDFEARSLQEDIVDTELELDVVKAVIQAVERARSETSR